MKEYVQNLSVVEIVDAIKSVEVKAEDVTAFFIERIKKKNGVINAFITLDEEGALKRARQIDEAIGRGEDPGPLAGLPIGLKDNILTKGLETTCASKILEGFIPPYDAHVTALLKKAGAVILGKLNMDEFAMGSSNENSAYGPCSNPWDTERVPGGSSGGAAAAVAAGMAPATLGSDTGGSIRQPSGFCGVVGVKPTYGRVSRRGLVAFASSLDQIGPIAADVRSAARMLSVIAGYDPGDSTSVNKPVPDYEKAIGKEIKGLRVGVISEIEGASPSQEVKEALEAVIGKLETAGAIVQKLEMKSLKYAVAAYNLIAPAEASSNLARYDGVRYGLRVPAAGIAEMNAKTRGAGFGPEVKRRIMLGTFALSTGYYEAYFGKAQRVRTLIRRDFKEAFQKVDAILSPTSPSPAFKKGELIDDPLTMYLSDIYTLPHNLAGVPAIAVPSPVVKDGLPIGVQFAANYFSEETLFTLASIVLEKSIVPVKE